jgi:hypothetical protein
MPARARSAPSALQRSRHTLNGAPTLAGDLRSVPDRLASLQRLHNVLVLRQECRPIQARGFRPAELDALPLCLSQSAIDPLP